MAIENGEQLLAMMRGFQVSCVLSAGADLDVFNLLSAEPLIREVNPGGVHCVLDVGGGPGIWRLAWLETDPAMRAILFDLPEVIPLASIHLTQCGVAERVELVSGDFYVDPMPRGADLVWVSAIIHQNSREENRTLYLRVADALGSGGRLLIRDVVMEESRIAPPTGVIFAVNMLVATAGGGTYTYAEIRDDLHSVGFEAANLARRGNACCRLGSPSLILVSSRVLGSDGPPPPTPQRVRARSSDKAPSN